MSRSVDQGCIALLETLSELIEQVRSVDEETPHQVTVVLFHELSDLIEDVEVDHV
jgi:hypothetical protein